MTKYIVDTETAEPVLRHQVKYAAQCGCLEQASEVKSPDDLYLESLRIYSDFITNGIAASNTGKCVYRVEVNDGPCVNEIRNAVEHYRKKAVVEQ